MPYRLPHISFEGNGEWRVHEAANGAVAIEPSVLSMIEREAFESWGIDPDYEDTPDVYVFTVRRDRWTEYVCDVDAEAGIYGWIVPSDESGFAPRRVDGFVNGDAPMRWGDRYAVMFGAGRSGPCVDGDIESTLSIPFIDPRNMTGWQRSVATTSTTTTTGETIMPNVYHCSQCNNPTTEGDSNAIAGQTARYRICHACERQHTTYFTRCDECDQTLSRFDIYRVRNREMCYPCFERLGYTRGEIHYYSYKPEPLMFRYVDDSAVAAVEQFKIPDEHKKATFMGFELEIECGDESSRSVQAQMVAEGDPDGWTYLKEDGSIRNGFEMVTHPSTLEAYRYHFPWEILGELQKEGARSWNTDTCGLHIHVGVSTFDDRSHFARFFMLFMRNKDQWQKLAGRKSSRWASFDYDQSEAVKRAFGLWPLDLSNSTQAPKVDYSGRMTPRQIDEAEFARAMFFKYHPNRFANPRFGHINDARYVALNAQNRATVELRFWKPSLKHTTVLAALEATQAAVDYTRQLKVLTTKTKANAKLEALSWDSFRNWLADRAEDYPYANARIAGRLGGDNPASGVVAATTTDRSF